MNRRALVFAVIATALLAAPDLVLAQTAGTPPSQGPASQAPPTAPSAQTPPPAGANPSGTPEQIIVHGRAYQNKVIRDFVKSYAAPVQTTVGQLARWKTGVCPLTTGLSPAFDTFVTDRIKAVAALVGAPVDAKPKCTPNVRIYFSPFPQVLMDTIRTKAAWLLGSHYVAQEAELATMRHPIQAWYATETEDYNGSHSLDDIGGILPNTGCTLYVPCSPSSKAMCPMRVDSCLAARASHITLGFKSEFVMVTVVVDNSKIVGLQLGALADYITMLALAQTKSFDGCRELPSITNLMSPTCDDGRKAEALTANDTAYLRALYQMDPTVNSDLQESALANWMRTNLNKP